MRLFNTLIDMLTYCRPHGSIAETAFCQRFLEPLHCERDLFGNWHRTIGNSPIVWSCHTDTVHRDSGRQTVHYDAANGRLRLSKRSKKTSRCLGADDTAGVFLCTEMIKRGIPGHYIFHYGEEVGGLGSRDLAEDWPELLSGAQYAIALDRGGLSDVITHQGGERTASDTFAYSLSAQLNADGLKYEPSSFGIYTDTAEYLRIVPECSNVSVGYFHAHTRDEELDATHVLRLLDRLCRLDQSALVVDRDPAAIEPRQWSRTSTGVTFDWPDYECQQCGEWLFDPEEPCRHCGHRGIDDLTLPVICTALGDDEHLTDWRDNDDRVYLSSEYAEVQAALREYYRSNN